MFRYTTHAIQRASQRSIPDNVIDLVIYFGRESKAPGDAIKHELETTDANRLIKKLKAGIKLVEKASKKAVVTSGSGTAIITVMNKN